MRQYDLFGLELSTNQPKAVNSWNKAVLAFLAHASDTPFHLDNALDKSDFFPMVHLAKGYFGMLMGRRELVRGSTEEYLLAKRQFQDFNITERENFYLQGLEYLISGKFTNTVKQLNNLLERFPEDGFAAKLIHSIQFILGDSMGMRTTLESIIGSYTEDNPSRGYIHGCYAFALEETGEYERAESNGKKAVEITSNDAWGLHAVAHVYDMTARDDEGIQWLQSRSDSWEHCNNFRYHCWWHLALLYLDRGEFERVLELYDNEVRIDKTDDYRDIANGASLLTRLELEGVDVGSRWEELADFSENRTDDNCIIFADVHYSLSLLADNRTSAVEKLNTQLSDLAKGNNIDMAGIAKDVGLPIINGLKSFYDRNYNRSFRELVKVGPKVQKIGGSHAQRDVFDRLTIESAIHSGHANVALDLLKDRYKKRGGWDGYGKKRTALVEKMLNSTNSQHKFEPSTIS